MLETIKNAWPWYVSGPLIGLTIPFLLLVGNKTFGISSSFRHICAASLPTKLPYFNYNWKKEAWNLFFVSGIFLGGAAANVFLSNSENIIINPETILDLKKLGLNDFSGLLPIELFGSGQLLTTKGFVFFVIGGFLVGFGTRYAGGCTSGHSIMGLSNLQWPSLVATMGFMAGGLVCTHLIFPYLFQLLF